MASSLSHEELLLFKQQLLERQSDLISQIQDRFGLNYSHTESIGELSSYDNHPADLASELFERGKDLVLLDVAEKELEEINKALHAIEEGTYGICRICSEDIPLERLKALPTADTCIHHKGEATIDMGNRPVEEEIIVANRNASEHEAEAIRSYDADESWYDVSEYGTSDIGDDAFDKQHHFDNENDFF